MSVSVLLAMTACNDVVLSESSQETGYLGVSLGMDDEVLTKAIVSPSADMAFALEVYSGSTKVATVEDHRTLTKTDPLVLPVGKYRVVATYGDKDGIGFDRPYYKGEAEAVITSGDITNAEIVCKLANAMVTVEFDQSIKDNFPSYSVFIDDGKGRGFRYNASLNNFDQPSYLPEGSDLVWYLTLVNEQNESFTADNLTDIYSNLKAQHRYHLKFSLSDDVEDIGYNAIKLVVDNSVVEQEYEVELDFSESVLPTVTPNEGFNLTNEMSVIVGDQTKKELIFTVEEGIKSMIIGLDSEVYTRSASMVWFELVEADAEIISVLAARGIKTQSIPYGATSAVLDITDYIGSLPTGDYNVDVAVYDTKGHVADCPMNFSIISDVDADMVSITPWAKFALAKGKYFSHTAPEGTTFMYKKVSDSDWTTLPTSALTFNTASKTFETEIGGLDGGTSYLIKAVSASDTETRELEFQTGSAGTLYNMNFENWYQDGKIYYPYAQGANPSVWDCANTATASFTFSASKSYTTPDSHSISGTAARLESENVVIAFAAGNLYTGKFGSIIGTSGASLHWGVPFTSRPVALKGYYDYTSGTINKTKDPYKSMNGAPDKCQILVILADWNEPFEINTSESRFVDLSVNNKSIIAVGKMESEVTTNGYVEFTLPLEYRDLNRTPKYIVVACCSSYLGDYFTGSTDSLMYVDEFSFEYDITKLTPEQKAKVNYR